MTGRRSRALLFAIALLSSACRDTAKGTAPAGGPSRPAPQAVHPVAGHSSGISDEELVAFVRWQREYAELFDRHSAELNAVGGDEPAAALRDTKAFEAKVAEVAARHSPVMKALLDSVPLKDVSAELVTEAVGGIYHYDHSPSGQSLVVARDEVRLDAARRRFGKDVIDDIVAREPLILTTLGGAAAGDAGGRGIPSPQELDAYVSGAGAVHLGMTEADVTQALGKKPSRRDDAQSPGAATDVAWDNLAGPQPGAALGRFRDDRLYSIDFAPAAQVYPRLDYATADAVTRADYVRRSVARTLRMADIESVTRGPGYRASWAVMSGFGTPTRVQSKWMWEVDPGDRILYVEELDGRAGQPVIRNKCQVWQYPPINSLKDHNQCSAADWSSRSGSYRWDSLRASRSARRWLHVSKASLRP